jgi:hypothetical protein
MNYSEMIRSVAGATGFADLGTTSIEVAERNIGATFAVLGDAVNAGEMNDVAGELGDEFADLMGRSARLERERASSRAGSNVLGVAAGAALGVVHLGMALLRRPVDAGMRAAGLKP